MRSSLGRAIAADVGTAVVAAAVMLVAAFQSGDEVPQVAPPLAVAGVVAIGIWSGLARRWPRIALLGAATCMLAAFALVTPGFSPALALGVPFFAAGRAGRLWWSSVLLVLLTVFGISYRLAIEQSDVGSVVLATFEDSALLAVLLLLGETVRSRLALRDEADLRLRLAEGEHQRRTTDQRLRAAHDLHDVLAHTLTVVNIQSGVAAQMLAGDPARARQALDLVNASTRDAMADLRGTIELLRDEAPAGLDVDPAPGLGQLDDLLDGVRAAGLSATLTVGGAPTALRPTIALAVFRVVQESLTNVLRHARATKVLVHLQYGADGIRVEVRDNGVGATATPDGFGLRGMAERVAALDGVLTSGVATDGQPGYLVRARFRTGAAG